MVEHQTEKSRFVINKEGYECVLDYQREGDSVDFNHTFVPSELRGQGLAEKIVREGLAWAKAENLDIHASCSYVQKFLK